MKKNIRVICIIAILIAFVASSLGLTTIAVKSIKTNVSNVKIAVGKTYKLKVTFTPANATNKKVIFSSSDKSIATVSTTGYIKGIKTGKTIITVTSASNKKAVAKCNVIISQAVELLKFPLSKPERLKIMVPQSHFPFSNDMPIIKAIQKLTNIDFVWDSIEAAAYNEIFATRLAAKEDMPDIMQLTGGYTNIMKLTNDGTIIPIDNYVSTQAPELIAYMNIKPANKAFMKFPDGKLYSVPDLSVSYIRGANWCVDSQYLKASGLKAATNLDELYVLLKKFKEMGIKLPITCYAGGDVINLIAQTHGAYVRGTFGWYAYNGKVENDLVSDKMKSALIYLNKLYKEGLLDKEYNNKDWNVFATKVTSRDVAVPLTSVGYLGNITVDTKGAQTYEVMPILEGPNGKAVILDGAAVPNPAGGFAVSSACKNPKLAVRFLSWCLNEQPTMLKEAGVEGIHYQMKDGRLVQVSTYDQAFKDGLLVAIPSDKKIAQENYWIKGDPINYEYLKKDRTITKYWAEPFPNLPPLEEEQNILGKYENDVNTYINEMLAKFINGDESFSNWDKYVENLKSMGLDEMKKIYQSKYDRYQKLVK